MARRRSKNLSKQEQELIELAYSQAIEQAHSKEGLPIQLLQLLIKQGSVMSSCMRERMVAQTKLYDMKAQAIEQDTQAALIFEQAIEAMRKYTGERREAIDDENL